MSQALSSSIQLRHIGSMPRSRRASSASEISPLEIRLAAIRVAMNMDSLPKPRLALIAGATASGKSALTLSLAERREGVVIYADSAQRSEEHTSELQSLMRISYAVFCLQQKRHRCRALQARQ